MDECKWLISQPTRVLGAWRGFNELFQLGHSLGDDKYMIDIWPHLLAKNVLTRELGPWYVLPIWEEMRLAIDSRLGFDTENWTTIDLTNTINAIAGQATSRFTVGLPLCTYPFPLLGIHPFNHIWYRPERALREDCRINHPRRHL